VSENRILEYLDLKGMDDVAEDWRKLQNEELHNVPYTRYCLNDQTKEGEMGGVCSKHEEMRNANLWSECLKERDNFEHIGVVERLILKWILRKERDKLRT
jgi:hypothetical protein